MLEIFIYTDINTLIVLIQHHKIKINLFFIINKKLYSTRSSKKKFPKTTTRSKIRLKD